MRVFDIENPHDKVVSNILMSLAMTFLVLMVDVLFCLISPRSFFYIGHHTLDEKLVILSVDALVNFGIFSILMLFRNILRPIVAVPLAVGLSAVYLISWATFLIVGDFLGLDSGKFVYQNFQQLLWIIGQISRFYWGGLIVLCLAPAGICLAVRLVARYFSRRTSDYQNIRAISFQFAILVIIAPMLLIFSHGETIFSDMNNPLRFRASPLLTLLFDSKQRMRPAAYEQGMKKIDAVYQPRHADASSGPVPAKISVPVPVVMIIIESLRGDILDDPQVMPHLHELQKDFISLKAYAPSNVTNYSWPAIFTSQYPLRSQHQYFYPVRSESPRRTIYDILNDHGYRAAIFSAQNEHWGGMNNILNTKSLDVFFSSEYSEAEKYTEDRDPGFAAFSKVFKTAGKLDDELVASKALQWLSSQRDPGFFIAMNFQRSHFPYTWPESFSPPFPFAEPGAWYYSEPEVPMMRSRYRNSLRYIDEQVGRIIDLLKEKGLYDKSLIFILGDHGEAFYEHGQTCHGNDLYNETAMTLVYYKNSKELPRLTVDRVPELIDVAPTILKLLDFPPDPSFQGQSLDNPYPSRPIFMTVNSPIAEQDAIIYNDWKLIADYRNGRFALFDLTADPAEHNNLMNAEPGKTRELLYQLSVWRNTQLKYHNDTSLQKRFYPPSFSFE